MVPRESSCVIIFHILRKKSNPKVSNTHTARPQIKLFDWNGRRIFTIYSGTRHEQYTHTQVLKLCIWPARVHISFIYSASDMISLRSWLRHALHANIRSHVRPTLSCHKTRQRVIKLTVTCAIVSARPNGIPNPARAPAAPIERQHWQVTQNTT